MKILVTGSAGFLGFHLCNKLLSSGHIVMGIDNYTGSDRENTEEIIDAYQYRFSFYPYNCTSLQRMNEVMERFKPEIVYHLACFPHEGLSVCSPNVVTESVTMGTMATLTASVQHGVKRFIYASSMARYGKQLKTPFTEDMTPVPVDPYGWAKYAAEGQIRAICEAYGVEFVIAVPHNIYGTHQKYDDPFRNVAAIMCNRVLRGKQPIVYGDGMQRRCFSYVDDLIPALEAMATKSDLSGHIINLGPEEPFITIDDLAQKICAMGDMRYEPIRMPDRPREVKHANCSSQKAKDILNVEFNTSLDDGLKKLFLWIARKGAKEFQYHLPLEIEHPKTPIAWKDKVHNK